MRKDKGYQRENGWACGENKSLEEVLKEIDEKFDERIKTAKREYTRIAQKTTLVGKDLFDYCRDNFLWEVRFKHDFDAGTVELIPLEEIINMIENWRRQEKGRKTYSYQKRIVNKDNQKFVYNSGRGYGYSSVRIPSMKRSVATWKKFYELFPYYREHYDDLNNYNGIKLKKVW